MENKYKNINIDILRILSMFMVVVLHTSSTYFICFHIYWSVALFYDNISRFSVPVFFMISGYLLLGREEGCSFFMKKRASKVLIPLLAWSFFYICFDFNNWKEHNDIFSLINKPAYFHLWFMYAILFFYALTPMLRIFIANTDRFTFNLVLALWVLYAPVYLCAYDIKSVFIDHSSMARPSNLDTFLSLSGFYLIGGYVKKYMTTISNRFFIFSFLFALSVNFIAVYFSSVLHGSPIQIFFKYFSPFTCLISVLLFVKFYNMDFNISNNLKNAIRLCSNLCFGVYLIHASLLPVFFTIFNPKIDGVSSALTIPLISLSVFLSSLFISYVLSCIPFLRRCI